MNKCTFDIIIMISDDCPQVVDLNNIMTMVLPFFTVDGWQIQMQTTRSSRQLSQVSFPNINSGLRKIPLTVAQESCNICLFFALRSYWTGDLPVIWNHMTLMRRHCNARYWVIIYVIKGCLE